MRAEPKAAITLSARRMGFCVSPKPPEGHGPAQARAIFNLTGQPSRAVRAVVCMAFLGLSACTTPAKGSIGAVLSRDNQTGAIVVRETPAGLAAARAGLLPGDRIKMIDGILLDDFDRSRVIARLRGPVGSHVRLTVIRGKQVIMIDVPREAWAKAQPLVDRASDSDGSAPKKPAGSEHIE